MSNLLVYYLIDNSKGFYQENTDLDYLNSERVVVRVTFVIESELSDFSPVQL